ncbi:hypothetical protein F4777DRAFT_595229 [Nemania sp. FL0916]|nr:hypothetical protein F4777DRAFT_595229 [Nemania sp. FL0916]
MASASSSSNATEVSIVGYLTTSEEGRTPADVIAIGAVFSVLAAIPVALRFYCHLRVTRSGLGVDDWLILAAFVLALGMGLALIIGAAIHALAQPSPQGQGPDDYYWVTNDAEIKTQQIFWAFLLVQTWAFGLAKLSVLFFYRRIFPSKAFGIITVILIVFITSCSIAFFFAFLFHCGTYFEANWAPLGYLVQHCWTTTPLTDTLTVTDVVTDVFILSLPVYWVSKLNMPWTKRLAVISVFLLGAIEIGTATARLVIFFRQSTNYVANADGIGLLTTPMIWSMIEMSIAIVAACLPPIWPLISRISIGYMMRNIRSVLSLEFLRIPTKVYSRSGSQAGNEPQYPDQDIAPYEELTRSKERYCNDSFIAVEETISVHRSSEWVNSYEESLRMQDLSAQTRTQISSPTGDGDLV